MADTPTFSEFDYAAMINVPEVTLRAELLERRLECLGAQPAARVLEVGTGSGEVAVRLARRFAEVTCVECDARNAALLLSRLRQAQLPAVKLIAATVEEADLPQDYYDHIVLVGILEHLPEPVAVLRKLAGSLAAAGTIHIVVNLAHSLHRLLGVEMGQISQPQALSESDYRLGHYRVYTPEQLRGHITQAGLSLRYEQPFYLKPFPMSMMKSLPAEIHQALFTLGQRLTQFASYIYVEANRIK